ncbi:MAG: hypothetical protein IKH04_01970 [Kiritimatiellae bacterium]|nr:hypothetical protein [Kiritimatiellia bacterium]
MKHIAASLTFAIATSAAWAGMTPRDSSQFTYKYEMDILPTAETQANDAAKDFTGGGAWLSLGGDGTVSMDMSTGNKSLTSSADVGSDGDLWKALGATHDTGYTIETRLKYSDVTGSAGAFFLNASLSGGKRNAFLHFYDGNLKWGSTVVTNNMTTSDWHTYRVVRIAGEERYLLYIDGTLVSASLGNAYNGELDRFIFGAGGGNYKSKAQVDYLRLTTGAYVPVPVPKASIDFPVKYEMDADDTRISASANASDWTISGYSGATIGMNGVLSVVPNGQQTYWRTTDSAWKNLVTANTAFTVEFSAKINSCTISGGDRTLQFWAATPRATGSGVLNIGMNHVYWQPTSSMDANIELDSSDNSDHKHVFRITYDGASSTGFTVWRDGVKIGENLGGNQTWTGANFNMVRFGIPGTTVGGAFDIYYIRWDTTGAYDWKESSSPFVIVVR